MNQHFEKNGAIFNGSTFDKITITNVDQTNIAINKKENNCIDLSRLEGAGTVQVVYTDIPNYTLQEIQEKLGKQTITQSPLTLTAIANLLGVKLRKVQKWSKGKSIPYIYRLAFHLMIEDESLSKLYKIQCLDFHWVEEE